MKRKLIELVATVCFVASLGGAAVAQDAAQVVADGTRWMQSSPEERKAFIIGAANMMALESAYAKKKGTAPPLAGTRAAAALENMTLDQITDRITRWYEANPGRRTMPVIGVIWMDMVEPVASRE